MTNRDRSARKLPPSAPLAGRVSRVSGAARHIARALALATPGAAVALDHEQSPPGITVNEVAPRPVATARETRPSAHRADKTTRLSRQGTPDAIAAALVRLAWSGGRSVIERSIPAHAGQRMAG